jgi:hypothetical protein
MTTAIEQMYFPIKNSINDFGDIESVLQHKFNSIPTFLQGYISKDIVEDSGIKQYATVANFPEFVQNLIIDNKKDFHLYELIPAEKPVNVYFDLEWDAGQLSEKETLEYALGVIAECLQIAGFSIGEGLTIFCSSGEVPKTKLPSGKKASYHIICSMNEVFRNIFEHKQFINNILLPYINNDIDAKTRLFWTDNDGVSKCIIDDHPYSTNQNFRLPYQSKLTFGKPRQLVPYNISEEFGIKDAGIYTIGLYCDETKLKYITLPEYTKNYNKISSHMPIQFMQKESPQFATAEALCELISIDRINHWGKCRDLIWCLWGIEQTPRMFELINRVCSRSPKYNHNTNWTKEISSTLKFKGINFPSLVFWAKQDSNETDVKKVLKTHKIEYNKELFECSMIPSKHTILNERYLGDSVGFFKGSNTIVIKSHLGTGKTVSISNIIQKGGYKRILVVSPRKSYTHAQSGSLDGFVSYLDHIYGDLAHVSHLIIQVESLHRIGNGFQKYDLVILDEIESILNQLHSIKTNAGNLITNHEVLSMAVSTASNVVLSDAFVSDRTFHFCKELRSDDTTEYFENTFNPYKRKAILLPSIEKDKRIANIGGFCERICEALRAGKKIAVVWTSKRRGDWFIKNFLDNWISDSDKPSWIFYNSDSTKDEQEGLKNVNETWRNVQCLMMTTSITVGISYDPKIADIEFDELFLYGSSASATPRDISQSLMRIRSLKANKLTYVTDTRASYENGVRGFNNIWNELTRKEDKLIRNHPFVHWTIAPLWAKYNYCFCENEQRNSRAEYKTVLEEYLIRSGYTLLEEVHIPSQKVSAIRVDLDDKDALMWDNIDSISSEVADNISKAMKHGEATMEDILCYKKLRFCSEMRPDCSEEDLKSWWGRFYESGCESRFWNVVLEKRMTVTDLARSEALKRYGIMSGDSIKKRETLESFLKIVGMTHSQEEILISSEKLDEIGIQLSKIEKELREGLRLRASRSKGEWKVANTIDLIRVILEEWGCGTVESKEKRFRKEGKIVREYSLTINKDNTVWKNIICSNMNYNDNLLIL